MIRFILVTFAFLAWAFWVMSGGSDFQPEERAHRVEPAPVAAPAAVPTPEPAAPATTPEPAPTPQTPVAAPAAEAPAAATAPLDSAILEAVATASQPAPAEPAPTAEPTAAPSPAPEPQSPVTPPAGADLRRVNASRVNMRSGPSTDFRVLDRLVRDQQVEVVEIDTLGPEPWARLIVLDTGMEGWMAARFLTAQ